MVKNEIIKGLKIATNKIGGCSDVGGWLSDDESKARYACEQVIKGFEDGTIILREEDECDNEENVKAAEQEYHGKLVDLDEYTKAVCQASCNKKLYECNNRCNQVEMLLAMPTVKDATLDYKLKNYVSGMKGENK